MPTIDINGTKVTYTLARNVSLNWANPHRLTATCQCGVGFMQLAAASGIEKRLEKCLRQGLEKHKASGRCKLPQATKGSSTAATVKERN